MTCLKSAVFIFAISLLRPFLFSGWVCDLKLSSFEGVEEPTGKKDNAPVTSKNQKATSDSYGSLTIQTTSGTSGRTQLIVFFLMLGQSLFHTLGYSLRYSIILIMILLSGA